MRTLTLLLQAVGTVLLADFVSSKNELPELSGLGLLQRVLMETIKMPILEETHCDRSRRTKVVDYGEGVVDREKFEM